MLQTNHTHTSDTPLSTSTNLRQLLPSSRQAYAVDARLFAQFGGTIPCDAKTILRYVDQMRTRTSPLTIYRRIHSIRRLHLEAGHPPPTDDPAVRQVLRWLQSGRFPPRGKAAGDPSQSDEAMQSPGKRVAKSARPLTRPLLLKLLDTMHRSMLDRRDRALLLIGFFCAMKRSVLVQLDVKDIEVSSDALLVHVPESEESMGAKKPCRVIAIPNTGGELDVTTAIRQYVEHLSLEPDSPLFRSFNRAGEPTEYRLSAAYVSDVIKQRIQSIGMDASQFSGESLRRGRRLELAKGVL